MRFGRLKIVLAAYAVIIMTMLCNSAYAQTIDKREAEHINSAYKNIVSDVGTLATPQSEAAIYVSSKSQLEELLYDSMLDRKASINAIYIGDTNDIMADMESVFESVIASDDYLHFSWTSLKYGCNGYEGNYNIYYNLTYLTTKSQEDYVDSKVDEILSDIIDAGMTSFEKELAIHDYIVENIGYDESLVEHSAYAALAKGKTVCQGYSLLAYKMFENAGLQARIIEGYESMNHVWNLVNIDGHWYHADLTWDDPLPDVMGRTMYRYFSLSDGGMSLDHYWDISGYPACSSDKYSYMQEVSYPVFKGDWIYYSSNSDEKLYKVKNDGSSKNMLYSGRVLYLCGYGEWLYYSDFSQGGYVYRIKTDGTSRQQINSEYSKFLSIDGNVLTYENGYTGETASIVLEPIEAESIDLSKSVVTMEKGDKFSLEYSLYPKEAQSQIRWSSSDESVASVDSMGNVTANAAGVCSIKAIVDGKDIIDSCVFNVGDPSESSSADSFGHKLTDNQQKIWTVRFSEELFKEMNLKSIVSITKGSTDCGASAVFGADGRTIEIIPPENGYEKGKSYRIFIGSDIRSSEGDLLKKPAVMYFMAE